MSGTANEETESIPTTKNPMVKFDDKAVELTGLDNGTGLDEEVVAFDEDSLSSLPSIDKNTSQSKLKHTFTMGGHDGIPLGFKIKDIMDDLKRRPGDDDKDKAFIKLLNNADKDGDEAKYQKLGGTRCR